MTDQIKIVTILDNEENVIGRLDLKTACEIEGWDYDTADFGLGFITTDVNGAPLIESRESRTDDNWNTTTFVWKVGEYA